MNKTIGKFLFGSIIIIGAGIFINGAFLNNNFFSSQTVNASSEKTNPKSQEDPGNDTLQGFARILQILLNALYALLWPLLTVAGVSMDNGLVYGEWFHMDKALWKFWNIMKTFAYYALGFIFIISILLHFFYSGEKAQKFKPTQVLPKILIGGVVIAFSWFILGVLLDFATLLTYGLGGMPLTMLKDNQTMDKRLIMRNSIFNFTDSNSENGDGVEIKGYFSCGGTKFVSCVFNGTEIDQEATGKEAKKVGASSSPCVRNGNLVDSSCNIAENEKQCVEESEKLKESQQCPKLSGLIKDGKAMTGPFYALYGSLLSFGTVALTGSNKTAGDMSVEFIIKGLIALALIIPLFALAIVMVMRVVIMWLYIGFSPILLMSWVFGFKLGKNSDKSSISSVMGLIFMPVTAVFAISISLIFLSALMYNVPKDGKSENGLPILEHLGLKKFVDGNGNTCYETPMQTVICIKMASKDLGISVLLNNFSWLIINFFGIALMWTIVFAALKTSKVTAGVVGSIEGFAKGMMKAAPIIPTPGGFMSAGGLQRGLSTLSAVPQQLISKNYSSTLEPFLQGMGEKLSGETAKSNEGFERLASSTYTGQQLENQLVNELKGYSSRSNSEKFENSKDGMNAINKWAKDKGKDGYSDIYEALGDKDFRALIKNNGIDIIELLAKNEKDKQDAKKKITDMRLADELLSNSSETIELSKINDADIQQNLDGKKGKKGDPLLIYKEGSEYLLLKLNDKKDGYEILNKNNDLKTIQDKYKEIS